MGREHGLLDRIEGVLVGRAVPTGEAVKPGAVAAEQFLEGAGLTGGVGGQQRGVGEVCGGGAQHTCGR